MHLLQRETQCEKALRGLGGLAADQAVLAHGRDRLGIMPERDMHGMDRRCAGALAVIVYGTAIGAWWLLIIGVGLGALALSGWVFEYYRGEHAH